MPTYDTHPDLGHPEVAGWVLGALDPPDAEAFGEHLASCSQCQGAVAEFEAVARAFRYPVPDAEPPPELEAKVLASVQRAVLTARRSDQAPTIQHAVLTTPPDRTPTVAGIQRPVWVTAAMRVRPNLRRLRPRRLRPARPAGGTGTGMHACSHWPQRWQR